MNLHKVSIDSPIIPMTALLLIATMGVIIPLESIYSLICFGIMILYALFSVIRLRPNKISLIILAFIALNFIYYLFAGEIVYSQIGGFKDTSGRMKSVLVNYLPFFFSYYYAKKGKLTKQTIFIYSIIFLALLIPKYYFDKAYALEMLAGMGRIRDDVTVNAGYRFAEMLVVLPLLATNIKYKKVTFAYIMLCSFFVVLSAKRGAILVLAVSLLLFLPYWLKESKKMIIPLLIGLAIAVVLGVSFFKQDEYLMMRFEATSQGYVSGRDEIFADIWNYCMHQHFSLETFLFGFGFMASMTMSINVAHNDWLELLSNFGLLGISLYLGYFILMTKNCINNNDDVIKRCYLLLIINLFIRTFFSMTYTSLVFIPLVLGYLEGSRDLNSKFVSKKC